jgi:uncharacterized protein (DUF2384 family)
VSLVGVTLVTIVTAATSTSREFEYVLARAQLVWGAAAAATWLGSANSYLTGARPIDVLRLSGSAPVLEALDVEAWGGGP